MQFGIKASEKNACSDGKGRKIKRRDKRVSCLKRIRNAGREPKHSPQSPICPSSTELEPHEPGNWLDAYYVTTLATPNKGIDFHLIRISIMDVGMTRSPVVLASRDAGSSMYLFTMGSSARMQAVTWAILRCESSAGAAPI
jgi:hypothetical protein